MRSVIWVNKFFIIKRNLNKNPQKKYFIRLNDTWLKSFFFRGRSHGCQGNDSFAIFGFLAFLLALLDLYLELGGMLPTIGRKKREISDHSFQHEMSNSSFVQTKKSLFLVQVRSNHRYLWVKSFSWSLKSLVFSSVGKTLDSGMRGPGSNPRERSLAEMCVRSSKINTVCMMHSNVVIRNFGWAESKAQTHTVLNNLIKRKENQIKGYQKPPKKIWIRFLFFGGEGGWMAILCHAWHDMTKQTGIRLLQLVFSRYYVFIYKYLYMFMVSI